jgi:hypothetical protein
LKSFSKTPISSATVHPTASSAAPSLPTVDHSIAPIGNQFLGQAAGYPVLPVNYAMMMTMHPMFAGAAPPMPFPQAAAGTPAAFAAPRPVASSKVYICTSIYILIYCEFLTSFSL